jgi:hypothetical protein
MVMDESAQSGAPTSAEDTSGAAVGVALGQATGSGTVDAEAAAFLRDQRRMVNLQMEHLHEERALQHRHLNLKYFGDRLRIGLELLAIAFGAILLFGLGALVWSAHEDHGLVVEAFSVPPDLAQRGLTGQVIASRLLDKLADMQEQTGSLRPAGSYANNWGSDLKVEIPQTGISIGEAQQLLRGWLGHETHISGEVFRTQAGLAVAARTGGEPAKTFEGADADLDRLLQSAAEAVYGATQPFRYATFLNQHGRSAEATPILERLASAGSAMDRFSAAMYFSHQARIVGDNARAAAMASVAIEAEPAFGRAYLFRAFPEMILGHQEASLQDSRKAVQLSSRFDDKFVSAEFIRAFLPAAKGTVAEDLGDWRQAALLADQATAAMARVQRHELSLSHLLAPAERSDPIAPAQRAFDLAQDHDFSGGRPQTLGGPANTTPGGDQRIGPIAALRLGIERAAEDWPALVAEIPPGGFPSAAARPAPVTLSVLAYGLAKSGRMADAAAMEAMTPADCYRCVIDQGSMAAMRQDWGTAERRFAAAVLLGPSLPFAHCEWGRMLLAKGDVAGAIRELAVAHEKGPHFADPLELWGEALMLRGDFAGAAGKFEQADKDAPRWGRNHMLWGEALIALGRRPEAAAQWQAANRMDLNAADRATLTALRGERPLGDRPGLHVAAQSR